MLLLLLIGLCTDLCPRLPMRKVRWIRGTGRPVYEFVSRLHHMDCFYAKCDVH